MKYSKVGHIVRMVIHAGLPEDDRGSNGRTHEELGSKWGGGGDRQTWQTTIDLVLLNGAPIL